MSVHQRGDLREGLAYHREQHRIWKRRHLKNKKRFGFCRHFLSKLQSNPYLTALPAAGLLTVSILNNTDSYSFFFGGAGTPSIRLLTPPAARLEEHAQMQLIMDDKGELREQHFMVVDPSEVQEGDILKSDFKMTERGGSPLPAVDFISMSRGKINVWLLVVATVYLGAIKWNHQVYKRNAHEQYVQARHMAKKLQRMLGGAGR